MPRSGAAGIALSDIQQIIPTNLEYCYVMVPSCSVLVLQAMSAQDFIAILRPAFQADEWKLILVGGILGAAAGAIQQFALFDNVA